MKDEKYNNAARTELSGTAAGNAGGIVGNAGGIRRHKRWLSLER